MSMVGMMPSISASPGMTDFSSMLGGTSSMSWSTAAGYIGPIMAVAGSIQSILGTRNQVAMLQKQAEFQEEVSAFNARMAEFNMRSAERSAQQILLAGNQQQSLVSMKAGKVKSAQKVSAGARGVAMDSPTEVEKIATTDLMKEIDRYTINANSVREAWDARMAGVFGNTAVVNSRISSYASRAQAAGLDPAAATMNSLLTSAGTVAQSWYSMQKINRMERLLGGMTGGSF